MTQGGTDLLAIEQLLVRYCAAVDDRDWDRFRDCFADDAAIDYGAIGSWTSAVAMTEFMQSAHERMGASLHRLSNVRIVDPGPPVRVNSYVDLIAQPGKDGRPPIQSYGRYDDEVGLRAGGWRILRRTFTLVDMTRPRARIEPGDHRS